MTLSKFLSLNTRQTKVFLYRLLQKILSELTFKIQFDLNGGTGPAPDQFLKFGELVTAPSNPTPKTGHDFIGWYYGGEEWDFDTDGVEDDMTLVANYEIQQFTVTFDADGGTPAPEAQTVDYDGLVTAPEAPSKEGYTFVEWQNNSTAWNFATDTVTEAITLVAVYTSNDLT
jgi:uncharacterized repeat protein (TIGR02543 family)